MAKLNLDKIQAKIYGNIESVVGSADLPNGSLVSLDGSVDGTQRELMKVVAPDDKKELLLVSAPEVKYDPRLDELDYTTTAGTPVRAYHLTSGDKFQVEVALFEAQPNVGDVVTGSATYGYKTAVGTEITKFEVLQLHPLWWDARPVALLQVL